MTRRGLEIASPTGKCRTFRSNSLTIRKSMKQLILATNNPHKISEMSSILSDNSLKILSAVDFPDFPRVEETGKILEENAILKVKAVWDRYHISCLADDTGLEVEYLKGAPGVMSARFAGPECSYDDNNRKLLGLLGNVPEGKRKARFRTVIAFIDGAGSVKWVDGILTGSIGFERRGSNGFGYDPIFIVEGIGKTLAEFTPEEKNALSHRGRALAKIRPIVLKALDNT
jgi:XTP/dITP diphosphohydrolase